jgi:hypothetical protein
MKGKKVLYPSSRMTNCFGIIASSGMLLMLGNSCLLTVTGVCAFSTLREPSFTKPICRGGPTTRVTAHQPLLARQYSSLVTGFISTALGMGIMEDFITGRDRSVREQENIQYLSFIQKRVDAINAWESTIEELGDDELVSRTSIFRERLAAGEDLNGPLLEEAFAVVREAAWYDIETNQSLSLCFS